MNKESTFIMQKRLSNKSYTGDAGVSPAGSPQATRSGVLSAGVLEQNEGFSGDL